MSRRAPRRLGLEPLGRVIARDGALHAPEAMETSPVAARDWEAAVGSRIAARTKPVRIDRGVLIVRAATSTWAQELSFLAEAILSQLRGRQIAVQALRFVVGDVDAPARPVHAEPRRAPPAVRLPAPVGDALQAVGDQELRDVIARAAARSLGWSAMPPVGASSGGPGAFANEKATTSARSDARGPRSSARGSDPPDRTRAPSRGGRRGTP